MYKKAIAILFLTFSWTVLATASEPMAIGTNVTPFGSYNTEWPFANVFRQCQPWRGLNTVDWQPVSEGLPLDDAHWPTHVPFEDAQGRPCIVQTVVFDGASGRYPSGTYELRFRGTGRLQIETPGKRQLIDHHGPGEKVVPVPIESNDGAVHFKILRSAESNGAGGYTNPIRDIQFYFPGCDPSMTFHPQFVAAIEPFGTLRFLQWQHVSDTTPELHRWEDRTRKHWAQQSHARGVALGWMVELCNSTGKNMWICVPHAADDAYVRAMARELRDTLAPGLRVYVEYSNETWNWAWPFNLAASYSRDQAKAAGVQQWEGIGNHWYTARRSGEIWATFREVYGNTEFERRVVRVLATQSVNQWLTEKRLEFAFGEETNPSLEQPQCLAIAPYFGHAYVDKEAGPGKEALLAAMEEALSQAIEHTVKNRVLADRYGVSLICYEGGQHLAARHRNNKMLVRAIEAANRDPRIGQLYQRYLKKLQESGVELFMHYALSGGWNSDGAWGALETSLDDRMAAPKYRALAEFSQLSEQPLPDKVE